ncbi:MAG TPA: hypothetical protein VMU57_15450 [Edaphobacter sp.]|uniref:hypothetical protein n=1 Tax=Edaphobacter sp. TaxID=1934404 RepID=UPI002CB717A8|nr:hypothetical protein [Edaphobacter sp.]HUZ96300.1 hypothetical protein [Edaphobacter sp.]
MSQLVPAYLPAYILIGSVATITAVLFAVHRELQGAGWPDHERRRATSSIAILLVVWFLAELVPASLGFFQGATPRIPMIQFGMLIPPVIVALLFWRWRLLRRVIEAVPQKWIAGVQFYRVMGVIFLVLYAAGKLPGIFAFPAAIGDILTGLFAPVVGTAYARNPQAAAGRLGAWNLFGIADLIVAVGLGFLTSPSPLQMLSLDKPNELVTAFPLVMVPVFLVPLAVLLHLASLKKLRQSATAQTARQLDGSVHLA